MKKFSLAPQLTIYKTVQQFSRMIKKFSIIQEPLYQTHSIFVVRHCFFFYCKRCVHGKLDLSHSSFHKYYKFPRFRSREQNGNNISLQQVSCFSIVLTSYIASCNFYMRIFLWQFNLTKIRLEIWINFALLNFMFQYFRNAAKTASSLSYLSSIVFARGKQSYKRGNAKWNFPC